MTLPNSRILFFLAALATAGLMTFSLFLQHGLELEPCPLCISQRIVMVTLGVIGLIAAIHNPKTTGFRVYGGITLITGIAGMALAIRQLYIQNLPPEKVPACMPAIEYLVDMLPFTQIVQIMLTGTGDCAEVQWTFMGLTIPGWTLIMFTGFTLFGLVELFRRHKKEIL